MSGRDRFPFEVVPSGKWPGWEVVICTRWPKPVVVGWYRIGNRDDEERQRKDLRKLRAIWAQTVERRQQAREAVAALRKDK